MENFEILKSLHHNGKLLILPNIWDTLGALQLQDLGFPAVATASFSIALSQGYPDGEKIPFDEVVKTLSRMVKQLKVPLTADVESCYAKNDTELVENVKKLADTGIAGINFEDVNHAAGTMYTTAEQCKKISLIKNTVAANNTALFINARTDVFIKQAQLNEQEKIAATIERGHAYTDAGADGFYPVFAKSHEAIQEITAAVKLPVNILLLPGIPSMAGLQQLGVARLSLGPGYYRVAMKAMKELATELKEGNGMEIVQNNNLTGDYLKGLLVQNK
ncbi:MAG: isocitrate lyase/phosphoenolpyruvate mutase family protein [Bacteroidetes bacterium]|nr:isocitrate lyase/phosphoenolpyruvate mutase family protein [Bacteroidota bacterium]